MEPERARIVITGAYAEIYGTSLMCLRETLAPFDPQRFFNPAWKQRRWDGRVRLYEGRRFPAGLWQVVADYLTERKILFDVVDQTRDVKIDVSRFKRDILPGITLYDHQDAVCRALLPLKRGVAKSPTGSGKTEDMAAMAKFFWKNHKWRSLIIVPKRGLARQTAQRLRKYYEGEITVGQCGDGQKTLGIVTVATAQTLSQFKEREHKTRGVIPADPKLVKLVKTTEVLFADECHHCSAAGWLEIALASGAIRRYGFSGTPLKKDELADMRLTGATGPVVIDVAANTLIDAGLSAKPKIVMVMSDNASGPELPVEFSPDGERARYMPYARAYVEGVVQNVTLNHAVIRASKWMADHKRKTLVVCRRKDHLRTLSDALEESGLSYGIAWGATPTEERDNVKELLGRRKLNCIVCSEVFSEGEDIPQVDAIILAEGVKALTNSLQRIGRGMRKKDGANDLWVVDFVPTNHPVLLKHAQARAQAYEGEGYEVVLLEDWPDMEADTPKDLLPFENWPAPEVALAS